MLYDKAMRHLKHILLILFCLPALSFARGSLSGYCTQGGAKVFQNGVPSTTQVMQSYPQCSITVYYTGGPSGTVTTSGTAVTWVTGTLFNGNGQWSGQTITINSVTYTISSCASTTACTLGSSAGTQATPVAYSMASTTPAAIYTSTGTAQTNPFVSSLQGYWQFYGDNGQYDIKLSGGGIPAPFTWGAQDLIDPLSLPNTQSDLVCKTAGCVVTLCSTAAALHQTLLMSRMWDFNGTCAANIYAYTGGGFAPASGHTTTLTGSFDGDLTQHFDLSGGGTVTLSAATGTRRPEWWGAKADFVLPSTVTTDSRLPIGYALAQGGTVQFAKGKYYSSGSVTASVSSTQIIGMGAGDVDCTTAATCLVFAAGQSGIVIGVGVQSSSVRQMTLFSKSTGSGSGQHGIRVRAGTSTVDNVTVVGFGGDGWHADTDNVDHGTVTSSFFYSNYGNGWYCNSGDCNNVLVVGNKFYNNLGIGLDWVNGTNSVFWNNDATDNTTGDYFFGGDSPVSIGNYCDGGGTHTMVVNGNYLNLLQPFTGACTISGAGVGISLIGQGKFQIDNGISIGGAGGANSINLASASASTELRINVNGKAHATVPIYDGSGGGPNIVLNENGVSAFTNGVGTGGANIIYRCLTDGAAKAGDLTSASGNCGTFVDSGLRTK